MILSPKTHRNIYIFGLILLAVALPLSMFLMSVAQFIILFNWLLEGRLFSKLKKIIEYKPALIFLLIFAIHLFGLLYTIDFEYAFKDIRIKLPLLLFPIVFATSEQISKKELMLILGFFIGAVLVASIISTLYLFFFDFNDIRKISLFISHIRFSLLICLAMSFLTVFLLKKKKNTLKYNLIFIILILWFLMFLFLFESATGITIIILLIASFSFISIFRAKKFILKITSIGILLFLFTITYIYLNAVIKDYDKIHPVDFSSLKTHTPTGTLYFHDTTTMEAINGHLIWINISHDELKEAWSKQSHYNFDSLDDKGQKLVSTLVRYMSSKGLTKDAEGFKQLSHKDIRAVEKGITNVNFFQKATLKKRIHEIIYDYQKYKLTGDANGLSLMMRFEFLKTARNIIKNNMFFGVGTGDVNTAYKKQYKEDNSLLKPHFQWRAHNQYVSFWVALGLFGLLFFLGAIVIPPTIEKKWNDILFLAFFLISFFSMFTEDTLETQAGVTFFAYFFALLVFGTRKNSTTNQSN